MNLKYKILVFLFLLSSLCFNLYSLSFCPLVGFLVESERLQEYVDDEKGVVSRLDWNNSLSTKLEIGCRVEIDDFYFNAYLASCIPNGLGLIQDYDYKNGNVIRYSKYENHLDKDLSVSFGLGYEFSLGKVVLSPSVGCEYNNIKHSAWSGYLQEPDDGFAWTGEEENQSVTGNGISYEQQIFLPFTALDIAYLFSNSMSAGVMVGYYPYVYADCLDSHYVRTKQFYDMIRGGYGLHFSARLNYERYRFSVNYRHIESSEDSQTFQSQIGSWLAISGCSRWVYPRIQYR